MRIRSLKFNTPGVNPTDCWGTSKTLLAALGISEQVCAERADLFRDSLVYFDYNSAASLYQYQRWI